MPKLNPEILASAMRNLKKTINIVPFETNVSEESQSLPSQRYVDPNKWGVTPIETWSKSQVKKIATGNVWDHMIYFLEEGPDNVEVYFDYFMDGIQRTTPIGKIRFRKSTCEMVPIHFAQVGIVLLKRRGRVLEKDDEEISFLLEYPNKFVMSRTNIPDLRKDFLADLERALGGAIKSVDTSYRIARLKELEKEQCSDIVQLDGISYPRLSDDELWNWCTDPAKYRDQARRWTTRFRDIYEQNLYDKTLQRLGDTIEVGQKYHFVLKDGSLTHVRGKVTRSALGVIKTFGTIFLPRNDMTKVFGLAPGYRSPVFSKLRPDEDIEETDTYEAEAPSKKNRLLSWYVRIRPVENHDPTWGLLRLEMHEESLPCQGHAGRWTKLDTQIIDKISERIYNENRPTSHPDPRWNNLIYPIKSCESYLRSRILSNVTARYLLGGV